MTTGERIKKARKNAGMTQKELADALGVDESYISQYETGRRSPKLQTMHKLAEALKLSSPALLMFDPITDEENEKPTDIDVDGLNRELTDCLRRLKPEDLPKVKAFIQGLLASREA